MADAQCIAQELFAVDQAKVFVREIQMIVRDELDGEIGRNRPMPFDPDCSMQGFQRMSPAGSSIVVPTVEDVFVALVHQERSKSAMADRQLVIPEEFSHSAFADAVFGRELLETHATLVLAMQMPGDRQGTTWFERSMIGKVLPGDDLTYFLRSEARDWLRRVLFE